MITNEVKMIISYNTHDAENNTKALTSSPLVLSKYNSWEEIREELTKQGFAIDEADNYLVVEDFQTISEVMSDFNKLHPKHVFNLLNTSGVLRDNYRFSIMEAVIEVCSFNQFVELVEEREDDWDEDIYLYEGYNWYDFGEMICENCGYQVPDALEPHIDYASFGETFKYNANVCECSNGIIEFAY